MVDNKWTNIEISKLKETSITNWMADNFNRAVSIIYNNEKPWIIICNNETDYTYYKQKSDNGIKFLVITAQNCLAMFGNEILPKVVINTFPDSEIMEIKTL